MADALGAAFSFTNAAPFVRPGNGGLAMLEIVFIYQLAQRPLRAMARLWWCRGLFRASRGRHQCPEYSKH
jgi:hypothetical protein